MSDNPAERVIAALENEPWLITQGAMDQLRLIAAREHDVEAMGRRYRGENDQPLSFVHAPTATAVLDIRGALTRRATFFSDVSGLSSTEALSDEFARLDANEAVERIVLRLDTPGGQVSGLADFAERIFEAGTPTVAYASDMAASAGYWLGSQADTFIASPTAIVGSIGVRGRAPDAPDADEMVSRHAPAKLGDRAASQAALNRLEQEFHRVVARGRGVTPEHVAAHFGRGGIFVGEDAVAAGLADAVSTFDHVIAGDSGITGARRRRASTPRSVQMDNERNDGAVPRAEHDQAVADAREAGRLEGHTAGLGEGEAKADEKATAERERVVGIVKAGEGKPLASVLPLAANPAITLESAEAIIAGFPAVGATTPLAQQMAGTNPNVAPSAGPAAGGEDPAAAAADRSARIAAAADAAAKRMN